MEKHRGVEPGKKKWWQIIPYKEELVKFHLIV